jgi:hypothetical protein
MDQDSIVEKRGLSWEGVMITIRLPANATEAVPRKYRAMFTANTLFIPTPP